MKHRTKEEIAALILEAIVNTNKATQTIIMYKAYLTYAQLKQFLSSLLEKGLIEYKNENRFYTITEKGMTFLQVYNQLNQLQTRNVLNNVTEFQIIGSTPVANEHESRESSYITIYDEERTTMTNRRRKCEKCLRLFSNHKELKMHKAEYHSY